MSKRRSLTISCRRDAPFGQSVIAYGDRLKVTPEGIDRRDLVRVELRPDPGGAPEVGDAALGRNPRACEHDTGLIRPDQFCEHGATPCSIPGDQSLDEPKDTFPPLRCRRLRVQKFSVLNEFH